MALGVIRKIRVIRDSLSALSRCKGKGLHPLPFYKKGCKFRRPVEAQVER